METHVRALGIWSMVFGTASVLASLGALMYFGGPAGLIRMASFGGEGRFLLLYITGQLLLAPACIPGGYFVRQYLEWARTFMIVVCGLNILNPPFGSLLGVYGLWVLLSPETEPLFREPLPQLRRKQKHVRTSATPKEPQRSRSTLRSIARHAWPHLPE